MREGPDGKEEARGKKKVDGAGKRGGERETEGVAREEETTARRNLELGSRRRILGDPASASPLRCASPRWRPCLPAGPRPRAAARPLLVRGSVARATCEGGSGQHGIWKWAAAAGHLEVGSSDGSTELALGLLLGRREWMERAAAKGRMGATTAQQSAEILDKHLSMVQRDHEQKSPIVERRIRDDAALEEAKRKEQDIKEEKLRQERASPGANTSYSVARTAAARRMAPKGEQSQDWILNASELGYTDL